MNVQCGPFEVDLNGRRLLKAGIRIPLREQAFQVLAALLERPGELVTREELRRRLWPKDTFVDFEVALNSAVSRLRGALADSVKSPRFIETVPKCGYRLVVRVARRTGVAVLPFVNQTHEEENEYFSDGLTDELIRELSRVEGLRVAARSVIFRLKGQSQDVRQVGRDLGVQAVLEGTVRKAGDHIRITVHLIDVSEGFDLWAERFDAQLKDVFAIQDQICSRVAEALKMNLVSKTIEKRPANADAYTLYLKGHQLIKIGRPDGMRRALEYFQEAIRIEPAYGLPYHGAALFYILGAVYGALPPRVGLAQAEDLLTQGLSLDEHSAMLQMTHAMLRMFQWRWVEAEQSYQHAISLEPSNAYTHMMYAILLTHLGRHDSALREANSAIDLDPLDVMTNFRLLQCNYYARHYEEAVRCGFTAMELAPHSNFTYAYVAWALAAINSKDEAWRVANSGPKLNDAQPLNAGQLGYVAGVLGYTAEARTLLQELEKRRKVQYTPALPIAWIHLGLGETTATIEWLETALAEKDPQLASINVFPAYDSIRSEPRFRQLARQIIPNA
jgi:TolB-like protein